MVCGWCGEERVEDHRLLCLVLADCDDIKATRMCAAGAVKSKQMTTSCDVELMLKMLLVEDLLVRGLFLSPIRLPNFFVIRRESCNLTSSRSPLFFLFFLDVAEQSHPFLSTRCWDPCIVAWISLLLQRGDRFKDTISLSCVAANPSFNGAASPDHLSLSFTWCGFSRSPFPFLHLVRLF